MGTCVSSNSISPNTLIKVPRQSTINFKSIKNDIIDRDEPQERLNDSLRVKSTNNRGILKKIGKFNKHSRNLDLYKNCRNLTPRWASKKEEAQMRILVLRVSLLISINQESQ